MPKLRAKTKQTRARARASGTGLVFFEDRGSIYDAPLEVVWDFMEKDETFHPQAHKGAVRNFKSKRLSDVTEILSWERLKRGTWRRHSARFTTVRPALRIQEALDGPNAGSTMVFVYSPRGQRTAVDVLCYLRSARSSPKRLVAEYRNMLAGAYREDAPWFRKYVRSLKGR